MADYPVDSVPVSQPQTMPVHGEADEQAFDLLVIGAGPTGLACAIEAKRAGLRVVSVDKGCVCNSLYHYPSHMTFFTTSELLEIGDIPFPSPNAKPTRNEALEYYRQVAALLQARHPPVPPCGSGGRHRWRLHGSHCGPLRPGGKSARAQSSSSPPAITTCPTISKFPARNSARFTTTTTTLIPTSGPTS